mmetsp:Transcript_11748/g.17949  ORF Transcript_11748/g.17949 Transcript_11748/m.17949 type:complete len:80 (+) Transcript_11748:601-840(+)
MYPVRRPCECQRRVGGKEGRTKLDLQRSEKELRKDSEGNLKRGEIIWGKLVKQCPETAALAPSGTIVAPRRRVCEGTMC